MLSDRQELTMPIFNDYDNDGKLLQTRQELLNVESLPRYINENNIDRAKGYIDCLEDMQKALDSILFVWNPARTGGYPNSPPTVRRETNKLFDKNEVFLTAAQKFIKDFEEVNKSDEPKL